MERKTRRTEQDALNMPIPVSDLVGCRDFALKAAGEPSSGRLWVPRDLVTVSIRNRRTAIRRRLSDSRDRFLKIMRGGKMPRRIYLRRVPYRYDGDRLLLRQAAVALRAVIPAAGLHAIGRARAACSQTGVDRAARCRFAGGGAGLFFVAAFHRIGLRDHYRRQHGK